MVVKSLGLSIKYSLALIKNNDEAIARWISHVISPHIVGVVLTSAVALSFDDNPLIIFRWLLLLMPLIVLPPLGYMLWLVQTGRLEDIYMPTRETRMIPLTVLMLWAFVCLGLTHYWQAPPVVEIFIIATTALMGILGLVTLFWKISFHGATISAAAMATLLVIGASAWPVMLLVLLVGWSRVRLNRHTLGQVIGGSLVGILLAIFLTPWLLLALI